MQNSLYFSLHVLELLGKKAAKQFNVDDMFEKARRTAKEMSISRQKGTVYWLGQYYYESLIMM